MRRAAALGLSSRVPRAGMAAALACCAASFVIFSAAAQVAPAAAPAAASAAKPAAPASAASHPASKAAVAKTNGRQTSSPTWRELRPAEQQSLAPLAGAWDTLSLAQKRKWQAMSRNFARMSPDEQTKLHSRMSEWVALSPQQRAQARLNFGLTRQLPPDEKKAKWEAYQALPPEEKSKLAAAAAKPPPTATAIRPVPANKLAHVPRPKGTASAPRTAIVQPGRLDRNTLLPRNGPASAPGGAVPAGPSGGPAAAPAAPAAPASMPVKAG